MRNRAKSRGGGRAGARRAGPARRSARIPAPSIAVIVSRYHSQVTDRLMDGAVRAFASAFRDRGEGTVTIIEATGAFELVAISLAAARSGRFAGVVALGCIVKGQTRHDQYIAQAVADGLVHVTLQTGVPVALGVLTVDNMKQARDRAGGRHGNKGQEAMDAMLHTIGAIGQLAAAPPDQSRVGRGRGR